MNHIRRYATAAALAAGTVAVLIVETAPRIRIS